LQPNLRPPYRFTITGTVALARLAALTLPDVRVTPVGVDSVEPQQWIVLAGDDLIAEHAAGLTAADAKQVMQSWPQELHHLQRGVGSAWQITAPDWRLRLGPRPGAAAASSIHLFLAEQTVAVTAGRRWLHQARYWLFHETATNVPLEMPAGVRVLMARVDGRTTPLLQPHSQQPWLPLSGGAGGRTVELAWVYENDQESLHHPRLEQPRLGGVGEAPALWTVHVPPGLRLEGSGLNPSRGVAAASAAGQDLRRASALLRLSTVIAERVHRDHIDALRGQLVSARDHFQRYCRYAETRLAPPNHTVPDHGPDGESLVSWRETLF